MRKTLLALTLALSCSAANAVEQVHSNPERALVGALNQLQQGELDGALTQLDSLTREVPNFNLAHLVRADLLLAKATGLRRFGEGGDSGKLGELISEARARVDAVRSDYTYTHYPRALLKIGEQTRYAILVEKNRNRLYVFTNTGPDTPPQLVFERYASYGRSKGDKFKRGDLKTPEGVYFVQKFLPDRKLPEKYGVGAFTLNYPNELDLRQKKTGYGIWIHGLDRTRYSRPPLDSEGCVVIPNEGAAALDQYIQLGTTPVVIAENVTWLTESQWRTERDAAINSVIRWKSDWESMDTEAYLSHYAKDFWADKHNLHTWKKRKRAIASRKTFQEVDLRNLSLLRYPVGSGDRETQFVAHFEQRYRSNNHRSTDVKRLYFAKESQGWRIRYEGGG